MSAMLRLFAMLSLAAISLGATACHKQPEGAAKIVVIGGTPALRDPEDGALTTPNAVLLQNVGQGLVSFDANGNIVGGLAERWNVSDDGLSYIFRLAATKWPDGHKVTAQQVAKLLKHEIGSHSKNPFRDALGAVDDIVAMTDRVIEIRLTAPRPNLLVILAQPELGIVRNGVGTGPYSIDPKSPVPGTLRLVRDVLSSDEAATSKEEILVNGADASSAIESFVAGKSDLVLGGSFADLPYVQRVKLQREALHFDPAAGLFGLVPARAGSEFDNADLRRLLSQAINRDGLVAALGVPGLAPRATVLEAGLDGIPPPSAPTWLGVPLDARRSTLLAEVARIFGSGPKPMIHLMLPAGPGGDALFRQLQSDWGTLGFTVERSVSGSSADLRLIDEVAPSTSPAWFVREFRCEAVPVCDPEADQLMDAARSASISQQRYALIVQAAAKIDDQQLFIPLAAPIRWSLVSNRIQGFAGNRFAVHTLTNLMSKPAGD
jgi:oligopeptide transport system substrate-binding protein